MKRYEQLELEIKNIVADIITESPSDVGGDTDGVGVTGDMLG